MWLRLITGLGPMAFTAGCKSVQPLGTPAPGPAATSEQPQVISASRKQAPEVPDAAEPAESQMRFK